MRVLIGVVHDADDRNAVAADLARNIPVEVLCGHDGNFIFGRAAWRCLRYGERKKKREREYGFAHGKYEVLTKRRRM
jgi:hypothetical protein